MLPSDGFIDWMFDTWQWLLSNFGGMREFEKTKLVLPTNDFFPPSLSQLQGHALAEAIFDRVRDQADMSTWPCHLQEHGSHNPVLLLEGMAHGSMESAGAAGTIRIDEREQTEITYDELTLEDPVALVATFSHELSHYLLFTAKTQPPGEEEGEEPATDVGAVFLGFGVFLANSAFRFEGFSDGNMAGWRTQRQGYLSQVELAYALAIFCSLLEVPFGEVKRHLATNPRAYLKMAIKHVTKKRADALERLRAIGS